MADNTTVHIGENSPEQIAYRLMVDINAYEDRPARTRADILRLYAQCLAAVRNPVGQLKGDFDNVAQRR